MANKENLNPLKTLVFSMGLLLIGGTILLGVVVWKKVSAETGAHAGADCPGGQVDLKGRGAIVDSSIDGHTMRVTLEQAEGKSELVMIDMCSGKITGTLGITSDSTVIDK